MSLERARNLIQSFNDGDYEDDRKKQPIDCDYCNNQGEVDITEDVMKDLEQMKGVN